MSGWLEGDYNLNMLSLALVPGLVCLLIVCVCVCVGGGGGGGEAENLHN